MARSKNKRKKKPVQAQNSGYKNYIRDVAEVIELLGLRNDSFLLSNSEKHNMYESRIRILNPVTENSHISQAELKRITKAAKSYYRERNIECNGKLLSARQHILLQNYFSSIKKKVKKQHSDENHPDVVEFVSISSGLFKIAYSHLMLYYYKVITRLSNPEYKYFGLYMRNPAIYKKNPRFCLVPELYGIPAEVKKIRINNRIRPSFRLGKATADQPIMWITVESSILGNHYQKDKKELDVYIQSHAIKRLGQRLDLLDRPAVNYILWKNTNTLTEFVFHRGYLLLPVNVYETKIGYLLADVVEGVLLFKTFLFITHNFTPEGDKLRKLSGLGKEDISYWKIDRLSTFIKFDENKYPALTDLFKDAGLEELFHLKEKDFDVEKMQDANLGGLVNYIEHGKNVDKVQTRDFEKLVQGA